MNNPRLLSDEEMLPFKHQSYTLNGDIDTDPENDYYSPYEIREAQDAKTHKADMDAMPSVKKIAEIVEQHMPSYFGDLGNLQARDSVIELAERIRSLFTGCGC